MIEYIKFLKRYMVEPWVTTNNPMAKTKKYKIGEFERGYIKGGENITEYTYIPLFKKNLQINFNNNLNVIVGENGTGKTQLFKIINDLINDKKHRYGLNVDFKSENVDLIKLDLVNGLIKNVVKPDPNNKNFINDSLMVMSSNESSHGENVKNVLNLLDNLTNKTILLDEPDSGLSIKAQYKLLKTLKDLSKHNQVIVISHSKLLIENVNEIYDFDIHKWINANQYLNKLHKL